MDIENDLLKLFNQYIKANSIFADVLLIVPKTPQSFSKFPTIVFLESSNTDYANSKSLNRQEYMDRLTYTVEIYSKDITINNIRYFSNAVIKELNNLIYKFFNNLGFNRVVSNRGEYMDITVDRHISVFEGKINNWNGKII